MTNQYLLQSTFNRKTTVPHEHTQGYQLNPILKCEFSFDQGNLSNICIYVHTPMHMKRKREAILEDGNRPDPNQKCYIKLVYQIFLCKNDLPHQLNIMPKSKVQSHLHKGYNQTK